ncbi:MAG: hypothetical protein GX811_09430, partial [Lentisphaerae bacterium]|nr:hypothetical protein [Lentisphaerota bacterium]
HTHEAIEAEIINGILYSQPAAHGNYLGRADLLFDKSAKKLIKRDARLIAVDENVEVDSELYEKFGKALADTEKHLNESAGHAKKEINPDPTGSGQSSVQTLIAVAIAEASGADAVIHGTLTRGRIPEGDFYNRHVWGIVPYDNQIGLASLGVIELQEILEENANFINSWRFKGVFGITYTLKKDKAGKWKVSDIKRVDGRKLGPSERIRVAFNSHDLASGGGRFMAIRKACLDQKAKFKLLPTDTRSAVFDYIKKQKSLNGEVSPCATIIHD